MIFEYISKDEYLSGNIREKSRYLICILKCRKIQKKAIDFEKALKMLNFKNKSC